MNPRTFRAVAVVPTAAQTRMNRLFALSSLFAQPKRESSSDMTHTVREKRGKSLNQAISEFSLFPSSLREKREKREKVGLYGPRIPRPRLCVTGGCPRCD